MIRFSDWEWKGKKNRQEEAQKEKDQTDDYHARLEKISNICHFIQLSSPHVFGAKKK